LTIVIRAKLHARFVALFAEGEATPPASARSVRLAETRLGTLLPRSYVEFASAHGSVWTPTLLDKVVDKDLDHPDLQDMFNPSKAVAASQLMWQGGMSRELVAFAGDSQGNVFCFRKAKRCQDDAEVLLFDHEFHEVGKVAKGFDPLLLWYVESCGPAKRRSKKGGRRARGR
jgi:hypothetical protein